MDLNMTAGALATSLKAQAAMRNPRLIVKTGMTLQTK